MSKKPYKRAKRGAGRHVQLPEYLQASQAWATLKPGPRALYIEIKRRFNGSNNGNIILSHRQAAEALNVHRNTVGAWFGELEERGFIFKTLGHHLGPDGIGRAALWALQELPMVDGRAAAKGFLKWRETQKPRTENVRSRHKHCDSRSKRSEIDGESVRKSVTRL
ncbi:MAG TPA: hypothetical protein DEO85_06545 [Maritimibacter sp.]|nr:hypothetical protein [Maritimibacter sp.]